MNTNCNIDATCSQCCDCNCVALAHHLQVFIFQFFWIMQFIIFEFFWIII